MCEIGMKEEEGRSKMVDEMNLKKDKAW